MSHSLVAVKISQLGNR